MAQSTRLARSDGNLAMGVFGAAVLVGLGVAAVTYARDRSAQRNGGVRAKGAALVTYLREHLSASDAAIDVVERLRLTHAGSQEGRLFATLFDEFREEREVVRLVLEQIGVSPRFLKRLAGQANGSALMPANGGDRGDRSLFRTLESLAIGVQAKRCMWRALESLLGDASKARSKLGWAHKTTFAELVAEMVESDLEAVRQEATRNDRSAG